MIVQKTLSVHIDNLPYWEEISNSYPNLCKFKIVSITEFEMEDYCEIEFTYDDNDIKYLFIELFFAGKKAGIKSMSESIKNITHY
jgi:hypothetical protein